MVVTFEAIVAATDVAHLRIDAHLVQTTAVSLTNQSWAEKEREITITHTPHHSHVSVCGAKSYVSIYIRTCEEGTIASEFGFASAGERSRQVGTGGVAMATALPLALIDVCRMKSIVLCTAFSYS